MRAKEFINEDAKSLENQERALPATYAMPGMENQDPYLQYRFGMALASARAAAAGDITIGDGSDFGENMIVLARSAEEEETLSMALRQVGGNHGKRMISTRQSQEPADTLTTSPIVQNSGRKITK